MRLCVSRVLNALWWSWNPCLHQCTALYTNLTTSCLKTIPQALPVCHLVLFFFFVQLSVSQIYYLMACLHPLTFLFCLSLCQERRCCLWTPQIWMLLGSLVRSLSSIPCRAAHSSDSTLAQVGNGTHIHTCPLTLMPSSGSHRPKALLNNSDNSQ